METVIYEAADHLLDAAAALKVIIFAPPSNRI